MLFFFYACNTLAKVKMVLVAVINACNASLRNQKFSTMAIRTRRQYLNDLAEHSSSSTTIDQANTSGRVGE